jgi:hypothetical protein
MNFITGEKLQSIAEIVLMDSSNPNNNKYTSNLIEYNRTELTKCKHKFTGKKIICIKTDYINEFMKIIMPEINDNIVIITHNADKCITSEHIDMLNNNKITHWYAQNTTIIHPKLTALPIGIANSQWKHGNLGELTSIIGLNIIKSNMLYVNFNEYTNLAKRLPVKKIMLAKGYTFTNANMPFREYLKELASYKFAICPEGNGPDCHRIWECLYLGVIPVVSKIVAYNDFSDLPILQIDDFNIVSDDFLNEQYKIISSKKYDLSKLSLEHWKKTISQMANG